MKSSEPKLKIKIKAAKPPRVKVKALVVFEHTGRLLLAEYRDKNRQTPFFRPPGGTVEFGERAEETARREIREELGFETLNLSFVGLIENIFERESKAGHEILLIYRGDIADPTMRNVPRIPAVEGGKRFWAVWVPIEDIAAGRVVCHPSGLLALLGLRVAALV